MTENTYRHTTYRRQMVWEGLIGHTVMITWRHIYPREEPWERYQVIDADGEWVKLQGVDDPKGLDELGIKIADEYRGGPIVVRLSDIEVAEIVEAKE